MEKLSDWDTWRQLASNVSRKSPEYTSNLYLGRDQIETWLAAELLWTIAVPNALLLLRYDRSFFRIYHVAADTPSLETALNNIPNNVYISDIIDSAAHLSTSLSAYSKNGFKPHTTLKRMSLVKKSEEIDCFSKPENIASLEDVSKVYALLERQLDPFAEQIPSVDDLRREVQRGHILVVRRGSDVTGMLMYELRGHMAHLRLWHVDKDLQGKGIGRCLMTTFLKRCSQTHRILLWVLASNTRAISIYERHGFVFDGLQDQIMIRPKERLE